MPELGEKLKTFFRKKMFLRGESDFVLYGKIINIPEPIIWDYFKRAIFLIVPSSEISFVIETNV